MAWDYAELSKAAKSAGGPDKFLNLIEEGGKTIGRIEGQASMYPAIGLASIGGAVVAIGIVKLIDYLKTKEAIFNAVVDEAKTKIIQGIEEYDAKHPNESKNDK